jgi:transglutaminase-like putative cysteine protease
MKWRIEHSLCYQYPQPVVLDAQSILLRPRADFRQQVRHFELGIRPLPSFKTDYTNSENNALTTAWFQGKQETLEILARSDVETFEGNPYDFILIEPEMTQLPLTYQEPDRSLLNMYTNLDRKISPILDGFLKPVLNETRYETLPFLNRLATHISGSSKRKYRRHGEPRPPEETIQKGEGACRDYAWLYIVACRSLGLAARFVSGYYVPLKQRQKPELHSWVEVFLPGAGWIGFDPSLGLAVTNRHIVLAASYDPSRTIPVTGRFGSAKATSKLKTALTINPIE